MRATTALAGLADALLRPHEVHLIDGSEGAGTEVLIERVVRNGSELRVELRLGDGSQIWGRVTREDAHELELGEGQILRMRPAAGGIAASPAVRALARAA